MHRLIKMKECLVSRIFEEITENIDEVDTCELGEAIDMIKDLEEAIYYHTITEAMGEGKEGHHPKKKWEYTPVEEPADAYAGQSHMYRKTYMEAREMHDAAKQMKELENYAHELTNDIMEMIAEATTEEKQMLRQKITTLAAKIK